MYVIKAPSSVTYLNRERFKFAEKKSEVDERNIKSGNDRIGNGNEDTFHNRSDLVSSTVTYDDD